MAAARVLLLCAGPFYDKIVPLKTWNHGHNPAARARRAWDGRFLQEKENPYVKIKFSRTPDEF